MRYPGSIRLLTSTLVFVLAAGSCARSPQLPELPRLSMERFLEAVRTEVQKAHDAASANPRDAAANGHLGMILQAHEQNQAAEICYRRAHLLAPKVFDWLYYLGIVQAAQGRNAEAAATLQQALRLWPDYAPADLRRADALFAQGDLDGSARIWSRHPSLPGALYGLGRAQAARGESTAAIASLEKACELFPAYGAAHYALSTAYRSAGKTEQAEAHIALYEQNKQTAPPDSDPLLSAVRRLNAGALPHLQDAVRLADAGRLPEAVDANRKALEIDPKLVQAHVNLISLYGRLGQPDAAERHFREAVAINPSIAEAHYNYGVLLYSQNKLEPAEEAFRKAIAINPDFAQAHTNLGDTLQRQGKLDEAASHFEKALAINPDYRLARFQLARLLSNWRAFAPAIDHFLKMLTPEDEQTPTVTYALAATYARAGQPSKALHYARLARQQASARNQTELVTSIDRDIQVLERIR